MGDTKRQFWGQKTFCLITGASQGIGQGFAVEFSKKFSSGSLMLLIARSQAGLEKTKELIREANPRINVKIVPKDLSKPNPEELLSVIKESLSTSACQPGNFELALLVHNAGSVGDVSEGAAQMGDPSKWQDYFSLNLYSVTALNTQFLNVFPTGSVKHRTIVNITSLCAVQPFKSMGYYCTGKAARQMFFAVLAEENPDLDVLSYSPGPVDTEMVGQIIEHTKESSIRETFTSLRETRGILTVAQTTQRIIQVLENAKYKSGQRVDYYDEGY